MIPIRSNKYLVTTAAAVLALGGSHLHAQEAGGDADHDIAMQLSNPVASLISLPLQNNFDWGAGPDGDGFQYRINIQPVIPFTLNEQWTAPPQSRRCPVGENRRFVNAIPARRPLLRRNPGQRPGLGTSFQHHFSLASLTETSNLPTS